MGWRYCSTLNILQWNARSLIANGQEFKQYVSTLQNKPHVVCIQETWLKPQWDFVIYGYKEIRNDRKDRSGGGVAIFLQNGIKYNVINIGSEQENH